MHVVLVCRTADILYCTALCRHGHSRSATRLVLVLLLRCAGTVLSFRMQGWVACLQPSDGALALPWVPRPTTATAPSSPSSSRVGQVGIVWCVPLLTDTTGP